VNNTLCIDTGCVFGGKLTALRWPEKELVDVRAERTWFEPIRPLSSAPASGSAKQMRTWYLTLRTSAGVGGSTRN